MRGLTAALVLSLFTQSLFVLAATAQAVTIPSPGDTSGEPVRIDAFGDWAVFETANPRECFATARANGESGWPDDMAASPGAQLLVTFRPARPDAPGEVSFWAGGRPIASGTSLTLRTDVGQFVMFSDGEWAWPPSAAADAQALATLGEATSAEVSLLAPGMVPVTVWFPLDGFEQAVTRAHEYCVLLAPAA